MLYEEVAEEEIAEEIRQIDNREAVKERKKDINRFRCSRNKRRFCGRCCPCGALRRRQARVDTRQPALRIHYLKKKQKREFFF